MAHIKRRRITSEDQLYSLNTQAHSHDHLTPQSKHGLDGRGPASFSSEYANKSVASFLSKHIPQLYSAQGKDGNEGMSSGNEDTRYCYRHRPGLKCRGKAEEESLDQLQQGLELLSQKDQQNIAHVWTLFSAAPAKHRELMLRGVMAQCCFPQLSFLSDSVQKLIRIDYLSVLPTELAFRVLYHLDTISLCRAAQVSQRWRALADHDVVWQRLCEQHIDHRCTKCGWGLSLRERQPLRATKRPIQPKTKEQGLKEGSPHIGPVPKEGGESSSAPTPAEDKEQAATVTVPASSDSAMSTPQTRPRKDVFRDRFRVGVNWKRGHYSMRVFRGHTDKVVCLQFDEHILATGSSDSRIKIWDMATGNKIRTLRGHTYRVNCLQFDPTKLISGGGDDSLCVWDWRSGARTRVLRVLQGRTDGITALHFVGPLLAGGSGHGAIRLWNLEEGSSFLLRGHTNSVTSVRIDAPSHTLLSVSRDRTARLWDMDVRSTLRIFQEHYAYRSQMITLPLEFKREEEHECAEETDGGTSSVTKAFEHRSSSGPSTPGRPPSSLPPEPFSLLQPLESAPGAPPRAAPPPYVLMGGLDHHMQLWDMARGRSLRSLFGPVEKTLALAADTLRAVSGTKDGTVKVWDVRSGRCERSFSGHSGPVTCIGLSDSRIVTGGKDGEVRMWCFKDSEKMGEENELGRVHQASRRAKEWLEGCESLVHESNTLAEDHPDRLERQFQLAIAYQDNGQVKEAVEMLEHVVHIRSNSLAEDDRFRLASQCHLAIAYRANGQVKEAMEMLKNVVQIQTNSLAEYHREQLAENHLHRLAKNHPHGLAENHLERLASQRELAITYQANGQVKEAVEMLKHVVQIVSNSLAENHLEQRAMEHLERLIEQHLERLHSQRELAITYQANGQVKEAVEMLEHVVDMGSNSLDEDHADRLASQRALAGAYQANGQFKEALKMLEHVVDIESNDLPEGGSGRLESQHELATTYQADGQVKEALKMLEHVVDIRSNDLAEDHPDRLASQHELAIAYQANGKVKEALRVLEHVVGIESNVLAENHPSRLASQHALAGAYRANGQVKESVKMLEHVVDIQSKVLAEDHPDGLASQHELAGAYQANGQVKEAMKMLEHVVDIRSNSLAEDHPDRLASQRALAIASKSAGGARRQWKCLNVWSIFEAMLWPRMVWFGPKPAMTERSMHKGPGA